MTSARSAGGKTRRAAGARTVCPGKVTAGPAASPGPDGILVKRRLGRIPLAIDGEWSRLLAVLVIDPHGSVSRSGLPKIAVSDNVSPEQQALTLCPIRTDKIGPQGIPGGESFPGDSQRNLPFSKNVRLHLSGAWRVGTSVAFALPEPCFEQRFNIRSRSKHGKQPCGWPTWGRRKLEIRNLDYPKLVDPRGKPCHHGVILKLVTTNICGSDQHSTAAGANKKENERVRTDWSACGGSGH